MLAVTDLALKATISSCRTPVGRLLTATRPIRLCSIATCRIKRLKISEMASDSDDEDLKAAIAMSLVERPPQQASKAAVDDDEANGDDTRLQTQPNLSGLAGLNRKAMEEERLARLSRKRERSISPPPSRSSRKSPKLEAESVTLPSGAVLRTFSTLVDREQKERKSDIANAANKRLKRSPSPTTIKKEPADDLNNGTSLPCGNIKYPRGVVKKTWAFRHDRTADDIKLEEVLEPATLKTAVLSAFQWDTNWVLSKLKTPLTGGSTKCAFVMQAKEDKLKKEMLEQTADWRKFLRLCFPSMEGQIHCMHSKLMLLFHAEKLRVAIPTANLLDFDWGETGVMENSVFMVDLPRLPEGGKKEKEGLTPFGRELMYYLERQGLDEDIRQGVLNFDFSATADMAFVHTVGGAHYDDDAQRTGLPGLARAVRELSLETDDNLEIDFAASSIGSLNDEYLRSVHAAARGEDMVARANKTNAKTKADFFKPQKSSASSTARPVDASADIRRNLRVYFPTHDTVTSSTAGAAGTICLSRKWYESSTFPRQSFRDYKSTRPGLLSHNKILYARGKQKRAAEQPRESNGKTASEGERSKDIAWVYVGSANMSESAWGKLVYDAKAKKWKLNCRNWECGVLLPVSEDVLEKYRGARANGAVEVKKEKEKVPGEDSETESEDDESDRVVQPTAGKEREEEEVVSLEVFDGIVEPPCRMPGERYGGRQPWYFQERR